MPQKPAQTHKKTPSHQLLWAVSAEPDFARAVHPVRSKPVRDEYLEDPLSAKGRRYSARKARRIRSRNLPNAGAMLPW